MTINEKIELKSRIFKFFILVLVCLAFSTQQKTIDNFWIGFLVILGCVLPIIGICQLGVNFLYYRSIKKAILNMIKLEN